MPSWASLGFGRRHSPVTSAEASPAGASFTLEAPPELTGLMRGSNIAPRISRREALQVPAVLRARNLIAGTLSRLPIEQLAPDLSEQPWPLFEQLDDDMPNSAVLAQTYEDLFFHGIAWWRVRRLSARGYPAAVRHVPVEAVHIAGTAGIPSDGTIGPDHPMAEDGQIFIDGYPIPDELIVRFDSPNPPLLTHAARAIRTCLRLDQTAEDYAEDPLPDGYFGPRDPTADPGTKEEIEEILNDWQKARRERRWGYVGAALEAHALQWSPKDLQLNDARQHCVLEIARAAGVDPEDLGVSTTSRTYQNGETRRRDLLDFTLGSYVAAMQDRLSMRDVTPRGFKARISFDGFLSSDSKTRMETYQIGLGVDAFTVDEIRRAEGKPPLSPSEQVASADRRTPAQIEPARQEQPA